jgi:hypothetical protein
MHDATHPTRIQLMVQTVRGGQFPPIWADGINRGLGYPLFHFYAPLFHGLAAFASTVIPLFSALKLTLIIVESVGILGVMHLLRRHGLWASLVGAALYASAPFLAVDLYVRGAYAEYTALALLSWVLSFVQDMSGGRSLWRSGAILSLFLLSHNLIPLLTFPMVVIWILGTNRKPLTTILSLGAITLGLTAWFLGPLVFERDFTTADQIAKTTVYARHFVVPWQIWNSTWGFGGSAPGVEDGMSFKLGKLQLVIGLFGVVVAAVRRNRRYLGLGLATIGYLILATAVSQPLWDHLSILQIVQFPWRSLGVATVLLAILGGYATTWLRAKPILTILWSICCISGALALNLKYFVPQTIIPEDATIVDIAPVVPEYQPRWLKADLMVPPNGERAYYPTWIVTQNGQRLPTYPSPDGFLRYESLGTAPVQIRQGHTTLEYWSYLVTIMSLMGGLVYVARTT